MAKKQQQISKEQMQQVSIAYAKYFCSRQITVELQIYLNNWLSNDYYYNHVQLDEMIELSRKIVAAFGPEYMMADFKELNNLK